MRSTQRNTASDDRHFFTRTSFIPLILMMILVLSGCGGQTDTPAASQSSSSASSEEVQSSDGEQTADAEQSTRDLNGEENESPEADSSQENTDREKEDSGTSEADSSYEMSKDRILAGMRRLYYIENDGSLKKLLDVGEDRSITYADACKTFFAVVCRTDPYDADVPAEYTLFLIDRDDNINETSIYIPEGYNSAGSFSLYGERFTYIVYGDDENIYTYDPKGDAFLIDEALTDVQKKMTQEIKNGKMAMIYGISAPAMLERTGRIDLYDSEGVITSYDTRFRQLGTWKPPYKGSFTPVSEDITMVTEYEFNDDYSVTNYSYHALNIAKRAVTDYENHDDNGSISNFVGFSPDNRIMYFLTTSFSPDYEVCSYSMKAANPSSDRTYYDPVLFEVAMPEGFNGYAIWDSNGTAAFPCCAHLYDGYVYYLDYIDGQGFVWFKNELTGKGEPVSTGAVDSDMFFKKFGDLMVSVDERTDPQHEGFVYFRGTYERFTVKDTVKNADIINKKLDEYYASVRAYGNDMAQSAADDYSDEENAQWMRDYTSGYSYSKTFSGIEEVAGHYLQLEYDGYMYWGGAHGMPERIFLLFDEETGERLTMEDLFKGTEDEFKEVVAKRTVEKWKTDGDYFYDDYDESREEEKLESFKESAFTGMCIRFMDDGVTVFYSPYEVGPYASGYIGVFVSYEDLGIKL